MDPESAFNDLGVNAVTGTRLMEMLDVTMTDLIDPQRFSRLRSITEFLSQFPEDTQRFLVNKATRSKNLDKLTHMFEYSELLKERAKAEESLKSCVEEMSMVLSAGDMDRHMELASKKPSIEKRLADVTEEIDLYHR
jgi:hypothetical protein